MRDLETIIRDNEAVAAKAHKPWPEYKGSIAPKLRNERGPRMAIIATIANTDKHPRLLVDLHASLLELNQEFTRIDTCGSWEGKIEQGSRYECAFDPGQVDQWHTTHIRSAFERCARRMGEKWVDIRLVDYGQAYHQEVNAPD